MSVGESVAETADAILNTVGQPLRGASLFYALYWLVEIEGVQEAAFDLKLLREEYHEGFWWYGIYSIARELSHLNEEYLVEGFPVKDYVRAPPPVRLIEFMDEILEERQLNVGTLQRHAESLVEQDVEGLASSFFTQAADVSRARPVDTQAGIREVADMFNELGVIGAMDRPRDFVRMARGVFDNSRFVEFKDNIEEQLAEGFGELPPEIADAPPGSAATAAFADLGTVEQAQLAGLSGWRVGDFDGPGWVGIAQHLLRRDDLSQTAWVDQSWAIEHNNANWLNKVEVTSRTIEVANELRDDVVATGERQPPPLDVLQGILDANRDGDMGVVFDAAERFNGDVGIDLRRLRRQVGV